MKIAMFPLALFALALVGTGCGGEGRPQDASPIVSPDSEAGKKAIAETENLLKLRKEQEASSKRHSRVVPDEG